MPIDLHLHSTPSDGTLTPAEIIAKAKSLGLTAVALTEGDTTLLSITLWADSKARADLMEAAFESDRTGMPVDVDLKF